MFALTAGYGSTGPYASYPGYDVAIEAEAGLMHITGEKSGPPVKVSTRSFGLTQGGRSCYRYFDWTLRSFRHTGGLV